MKLTGQIGQAFRKYGIDGESRELMSLDPYAIIDMAAAVEIGDKVVQFEICRRLKRLLEHWGVEVHLYNDFEYPAKLIQKLTQGKECVEQGEYRSTYYRRWEIYEDEFSAVEILEHRHDGQMKGTEWFVSQWIH